MIDSIAPPRDVNGQPINGTSNLPRGLFPGHVMELEASGITVETAQENGIYSLADRRQLASMLNRKSWSQAMGSALVYPYYDASGAVVLNRVKPQFPPRRNGKAAKYLSPGGSASRAYFPAGVLQKIADGAEEIIITEGEKKALAAAQRGFCAISIPGVDCWHGKKQTTLIADLSNIDWKGRTVFIAFDSDAADNPNVQSNVSLLAAALKSRGAKVKDACLPPGPEGEKVGLDDFLVANGAPALRTHLDRSEEPDDPDPGSERPMAREVDPAAMAASILALHERDERCCLIFYRGSFWLYSRGRYAEVPPDEMRAMVTRIFSADCDFVGSRHVSDVLEHLRSRAIERSTVAPPHWFDKQPDGFAAEECLPTRDSVVHLPSLIAGREPFQVKATPNFFSLTACEFCLDLEASEPETWFSFLDSLWGGDQQTIDALQEWFGYLLTPDARQQKLLLIVGPRRSGKGTIGRVLAELVGRANVAGPTMHSLTTNFGLAPLVGKSVAMISDARLSGRADQQIVVERILSITGEDMQTIDRKHREPVTCTLPTRFVILTNELPRLQDASGALVGRMILLQMTKSFYSKEDHQLTEKLFEELPGILWWAIKGWARLHERGWFIQPESAFESLGEMNDLASPVGAFVRECCTTEPEDAVSVEDLFSAWQRWCEQQGRAKYVGSKQGFARDLLTVVPEIRRKRIREGGGRTRTYEGIGLRAIGSGWSA